MKYFLVPHEALGRWEKIVRSRDGIDPATLGSGVDLAINQAIPSNV